MRVFVALVVLNSADVAVVDGGIIRFEIKKRGNAHAVMECLHQAGATNHSAPKLVCIRDGDGTVDIVWRVRTPSRQLRDGCRWQPVARSTLNAEDRWLVEEAMRSEKP